MGIDFSDPMPLYKQVAADIRNQITSGKLQSGDRLPSQRELADEYEVSLITVKKAISELNSEGILYSRVGKGTFVNQRKRRREISSHQVIGVVLSDLKSPYFSLIINGVEKRASEEGYHILLSNSSGQQEKEESQISQFLDLGADGLVIASMSHEYRANQTIWRLHNDGFPYVVVSYIADEEIYHVGTDHETGAYLATEHLISQGYEHIGYVNAEEGNLLGEVRKSGYKRALEEYEVIYDPRYSFQYPFRGEWNDYKSGYRVGEEFLQQEERPEALFIYNDLGALGFESRMVEAGVQIPEEVAIVGFDDIERCKYCEIPLTTIRQPTERIGEIAVKILLHRIAGEETEVRTILTPELVVRESCGSQLAPNDPRVSATESDTKSQEHGISS